MSYVIYHKESTRILQARAQSVGCYIDNYKSEPAAKAALTRLDNRGRLGKREVFDEATAKYIVTQYVKSDFAIAESSDFHINIEKKRTIRNSLTGEDVQESVNTPYSCSVASDHYWQS